MSIYCVFRGYTHLFKKCFIAHLQARYRQHIESTYGTDPSSQPLSVDPLAYEFAVGEPNKGRYYGLGSALTAVRHLPRRESHDSTSAPSDEAGSGSGSMMQPAHPDESLLRRLEELETRDHDRQAEMIRLQQEIRSQGEERDRKMREEADARARQMREEADARDRRLIESLDERERRTREWWAQEADRRDEIMLRQMFQLVKDARRGPGESSTSRHDPPDLSR